MSERSRQVGLTEFTTGTDEPPATFDDVTSHGTSPARLEPPTIKKKGRLLLPSGNNKTVGWWGPCPERDTRAFVSVRDSEKHRLKARDAYAISDSALHKLARNDVTVILIVESDTNDVYEYETGDFRHGGGSVPEGWLDDPRDTQTYRQRIVATLWEGHRNNVYRPRDEDLGAQDITISGTSAQDR